MAPYAAQFVPVKLDIGSAAYQKWRKNLEFTGEQKVYPYIFIVRSDGKTIYGNGGLTYKTELIPLMQFALETSGKVLNPREAKTLTDVAERFENLSGSGDTAGAIKAINKASRVGTPGQIPSYAKSAMKVNKLVEGMATEAMAELKQLDETIESSEDDERVDAILASMKFVNEYSGLKVLRPEITKFKKKLGKNKELAQLLKEAKVLTTAGAAESKTAKKRAGENLQKLIDSTEIEKIKTEAQTLLELIKTEIEEKAKEEAQ